MADAGAAELPEDNVVDGAAAQVHVKDEAGVVSTVLALPVTGTPTNQHEPFEA